MFVAKRCLVLNCVWGFGKEGMRSFILFQFFLLPSSWAARESFSCGFPWQLILAIQRLQEGEEARALRGWQELPKGRGPSGTGSKQKGRWQGPPAACGSPILPPPRRFRSLSALPSLPQEDRKGLCPPVCPQVLSQRGPSSSWYTEETGAEGPNDPLSCACPFLTPHPLALPVLLAWVTDERRTLVPDRTPVLQSHTEFQPCSSLILPVCGAAAH